MIKECEDGTTTIIICEKPKKKDVKQALIDNGFEEIGMDSFTIPALNKYNTLWPLIELGTKYVYLASNLEYNPKGELTPKTWYNTDFRLSVVDRIKLPQAVFNEDYIRNYKKYIESAIKRVEILNMGKTEYEEESNDKESK